MECKKYFETTLLMEFKEKHNINAELLSVINKNISDSYFESVQESDLQKQAGNSHLTEADILDTEYVDELDVGSNFSVECNSADVVNVPDVSQVITLDLIKERYPFITEVSSFTIGEGGTDDTMKEFPPADDATSSSDCLLTHITEPRESMDMTGIDSGEELSTNSKSLSSQEESIEKEHSGPYYCPDCGQGKGYSLNTLRLHIGKSKGLCKRNISGRTFYTCPYCQTDYLSLKSLKRHNTEFGDTCKTWQISLNNLKHLTQTGAHIPHRVQSFNDTIPVSTRNTEQDSTPYYCPYCKRGLGYSYFAFQDHTVKFKGRCKERFAGRRFYSCKYCTKEFIDLPNLRSHNKLFGHTCKAEQISLNEKHEKHAICPEQLSTKGREVHESCFGVRVCGTQELEGDCQLYRDDSSEYFDALEEIPDLSVESNSADADGNISESIINSTKASTTNNQSLVSLVSQYCLLKDKDPYYCPDCGRGLGYSIKNLKHHIGLYKGNCRNDAGRPLYSCKICKQEFLQICSLEKHYKDFGNSCKAKQISINKATYNFCAHIPHRVQSFKNTIPVSTRNTEQDNTPYYCPYCKRGLGYSYFAFQDHTGKFKGSCKEKFAGRRFYSCKYCTKEFIQLCHLKSHNKLFGDTCKAEQISLNEKHEMFSF